MGRPRLQIKEYSIDIDLEEYHKSDDKSYIYEWINLKNLKIHEDTGKKLKIYYDGYNSERQCLPHEASDIPYFHSSENKDFLDDLSDPTGEWKLRIRSDNKLKYKIHNRICEMQDLLQLRELDKEIINDIYSKTDKSVNLSLKYFQLKNNKIV